MLAIPMARAANKMPPKYSLKKLLHLTNTNWKWTFDTNKTERLSLSPESNNFPLSQWPFSVLTPVSAHWTAKQLRMEKFWSSEDLVEELLPFLDLASVSALASIHPLTLALIERDVVWQAILLKTFKQKSELLVDQWEEKVDLLMDLVQDDPDDQLMLQSLIHHICKNFPPTPSKNLDKEQIRISLKGEPTANDRLISPIGFVLLERVWQRSTKCSNLFIVKNIQVESWEIVREALSSAISRQDEEVELFDWISEHASVEDLLSIRNLLYFHCRRFEVEIIGQFFHFYWNNDASSLQEGREGWCKESWDKITYELLEVKEDHVSALGG